MEVGKNYQRREIKLKLRLLALTLSATMLLTAGCTNILDKITKKQDAAAPAVANKAGADQSQTPDFSLTDLQVALRDSKNVKLVAQDTGQSLALDETKRKELIKYLADAGELKESKALALAVGSAEFPAYQIQLEDINIKLDVFDSLRFGAGSENERHYFMEKGEIWKSVNKWLPARAYQETSLGYLFKASKVTVKGGIFVEETDQTPARNAILRVIRSVNLQSAPLPQDPGEALTLTFTVSGTKHTVKVYGDYINYRNATYKLPQGKQNIENLLSPG